MNNEKIKILEKAYLKARNSAAGLTNYCEENANVRKCEKSLDEAEALFREYQTTQPKPCLSCNIYENDFRTNYCGYCGRSLTPSLRRSIKEVKENEQ